MNNNNLLQNLNSEQLKAVQHQDGPLLIIAGAGTGKTTVITQRIAYLIEQGKARADQVLALTFTEKAAGEMEERVDRLLPMGYLDLWISTFHSFGERVLKDHGLEIGLPADAKLLNEFEQWALVKKNLDKFDLDYYRPLGNPTKFIHALVKHFSRLKDEDVSPADYIAYAEELRENMDSILSGVGSKRKSPKSEILNSKQKSNSKTSNSKQKGLENLNLENSDLFRVSSLEFSALTNNSKLSKKEKQEILESEINRINEVANAYHVYQQLLLDNNAMDFGDLINYCLRLFRERPAVLEQYRQKFKYILLDEFQDTNWAQYELVKLLAAPSNNLVVVGDDDQCLPGNTKITVPGGAKRIDKIKPGDKVASAVGKGYLSYSQVNHVNKNKKNARLLEFTTSSGKKLKATDNHKFFCYTPASQYEFKQDKNFKKFFYVYLMHKQHFGWRLGITCDLNVRLKLERSADKIVALEAYKTEAEARYRETYLSLKYAIPTICFAERGGVMDKKVWSDKLYRELDVEAAVRKLAHDLKIDLNAHQVSLEAVNRGGKVRIKINLEMCHRRYRTKYDKNSYLHNPKVTHVVTLETSHQETINKLKKQGFKMNKSKKGQRLRISSMDLQHIGSIAERLRKITDGIIENRISVGKVNIVHRKAVVVPAGNVLPGMFLPITTDIGIVYDQVISRKEENRSLMVYDLEVERTHNFVANGIVVHNSVYKFRGASVSNIMQFKQDFPAALDIVLTKNYRNAQEILDLSYGFIQLNNPNRLEYSLGQKTESRKQKAGDGTRQDGGEAQKLSKKLEAQTGEKGVIEVVQGEDLGEEMRLVVEKVADIKLKDKEAGWNDFGVLVRANESAKEVCAYLEAAGLPHLFLASRGLYAKPVVMDTIAYLKLLDNYHESPALYRVLNLPVFGFSYQDLVNLNYWSKKKAWSLYETLKSAKSFRVGGELTGKINRLITLMDKHSALARDKSASEVILAFWRDSGYLKWLSGRDEAISRENIGYLNQFIKRVQKFEAANDEKTVKNFLAELNLEIESGEQGSISPDAEAGPEAIKVMTVHGAKGLEFKYVFITNLVDKRFPVIERKEPIEIPDALVKEILPEGDIHLEEERRLFYVAMTRAKRGLYFSWAPDYGGARRKKPSRFLFELGLLADIGSDKIGTGKNNKGLEQPLKQKVGSSSANYRLPSYFSYTQLAAFANCPYQYRFAHILKVPRGGKHVLSFGQTMHLALQKLFQLIREKQGLGQGSLFQEDNKEDTAGGQANVSLKEIYRIYDECWIDNWYDNAAQKKEYYELGKASLKEFYQKHKDNWPTALSLEQGMNLKLGGYRIFGKIDRIDDLGKEGIRIVDYKTGQPKKAGKISADDKEQLLIYQLGARQTQDRPIAGLQFYYLNDNSEIDFLGSDKELAKMEEKILGRIGQIEEAAKTGVFEPKPGPLCKYCDFFDICEYRKG